MSAYLHYQQLHSCLGDDLHTAAAAVIAGQQPQASHFVMHERGDTVPYLAVRHSIKLETHLCNMLDAIQQKTGGFANHLLIVASSGLDIAYFEQLTDERGHFHASYATPLHKQANFLQQRYSFANSMVINTACSSAANALLYGARLLPQYSGVVVLTFEPQSRLIQQGFATLALTSPSGQCRPFHPERDGLLLGEAYAAVLLNHQPEGSLCQLLGGYSACDTSSVTGTRPDGSHILHVSKKALANAKLNADAIDLVKLHGTATSANDDAETAGSLHWLSQPHTKLCALKPWLGHNLGACGLTETLLLSATLQQGHIPVHKQNTNDHLLLPLASDRHWPRERTRTLANFFGFGGNNACLILETQAGSWHA